MRWRWTRAPRHAVARLEGRRGRAGRRRDGKGPARLATTAARVRRLLLLEFRAAQRHRSRIQGAHAGYCCWCNGCCSAFRGQIADIRPLIVPLGWTEDSRDLRPGLWAPACEALQSPISGSGRRQTSRTLWTLYQTKGHAKGSAKRHEYYTNTTMYRGGKSWSARPREVRCMLVIFIAQYVHRITTSVQ